MANPCASAVDEKTTASTPPPIRSSRSHPHSPARRHGRVGGAGGAGGPRGGRGGVAGVLPGAAGVAGAGGSPGRGAAGGERHGCLDWHDASWPPSPPAPSLRTLRHIAPLPPLFSRTKAGRGARCPAPPLRFEGGRFWPRSWGLHEARGVLPGGGHENPAPPQGKRRVGRQRARVWGSGWAAHGGEESCCFPRSRRRDAHRGGELAAQRARWRDDRRSPLPAHWQAGTGVPPAPCVGPSAAEVKGPGERRSPARPPRPPRRTPSFPRGGEPCRAGPGPPAVGETSGGGPMRGTAMARGWLGRLNKFIEMTGDMRNPM